MKNLTHLETLYVFIQILRDFFCLAIVNTGVISVRHQLPRCFASVSNVSSYHLFLACKNFLRRSYSGKKNYFTISSTERGFGNIDIYTLSVFLLDLLA